MFFKKILRYRKVHGSRDGLIEHRHSMSICESSHSDHSSDTSGVSGNGTHSSSKMSLSPGNFLIDKFYNSNGNLVRVSRRFYRDNLNTRLVRYLNDLVKSIVSSWQWVKLPSPVFKLWAHFDFWPHLEKARLKVDSHSSRWTSVQQKYEAVTIGL